MSDQSGPAAHDDSRDLPDRLSLRHSKLEAKRRLAAGEFTTLHDAQLAVAREHGMSSWAALKEHIAAAEAEHGHALAQVRWVFGRYAEAGAPGWTAPDRDELSEHFTEHFLTLVPPETAAAILAGRSAQAARGPGSHRRRPPSAAREGRGPAGGGERRAGGPAPAHHAASFFSGRRPRHATRGSRSRPRRASGRCPSRYPALSRTPTRSSAWSELTAAGDWDSGPGWRGVGVLTRLGRP